MKRADGWTFERPTKAGKYKLSRHPSRRGKNEPHTLERSVMLIPRWLIDGGESVEPRALAVRLDSDLESVLVRVSDACLDGALWREYVEPADPHAVTGAETGPWKSYRMSDDPMTPNLRLILDGDVGIVTLYEADMTSRSETAQETALHDKIIMSPADARWLRDQLNAADLSDPPEVRS